jgi:hypothetical protein
MSPVEFVGSGFTPSIARRPPETVVWVPALSLGCSQEVNPWPRKNTGNHTTPFWEMYGTFMDFFEDFSILKGIAFYVYKYVYYIGVSVYYSG